MLHVFAVSLCLAFTTVDSPMPQMPQQPKGIPWPGGVWPKDGKEYPANAFIWIKQADWDQYVAAMAKWDKESAYKHALAEVNATRAGRGLPPFQYDEGLTRAAQACAQFRAERLIEGHTGNDFAFVPAGAQATASGCAAWGPAEGWGSCCTYDRYAYAGAAYAMGRDGRRYMQLFVR